MDLGDFHGVRTFLVQAFGQLYSDVIDAGEIAKLITEDLSEDVGTTVKTDGQDSDPYGYATIIPLALKGQSRSLEMLRAFALKTCPKDLHGRLTTDFGKDATSVVFSDRFVNLPAEVASPLFKQLLDDLKNAAKEDFRTFKTERVLISTPIYREVASSLNIEVEEEEDDEEMAQPKSKKRNAPKSKIQSSPLQNTKYYYGEAEMLDGLCEYSWEYKVDKADRVSDSKRAFGDVGIEGGRKCFMLTFQNFSKFINSIDSYIQ
jgi:protein BCP1